jgi:hypothetical protein
MDAVAMKDVAGDRFSGASALAGLILVFLGGVLSSYDSFDTDAKFAVRARYRRNGAWKSQAICVRRATSRSGT